MRLPFLDTHSNADTGNHYDSTAEHRGPVNETVTRFHSDGRIAVPLVSEFDARQGHDGYRSNPIYDRAGHGWPASCARSSLAGAVRAAIHRSTENAPAPRTISVTAMANASR